MHRRSFLRVSGLAAAGLPVAGTVVALADPAAGLAPFTRRYNAVRKRFLHGFEFGGQVAESANGPHRKFSDQTLYLGFALLTFAGEARVLAQAGKDPRDSEKVVRRLLEAFELLDRKGSELYKASAPGFFLRDYVTSLPGRDPGDVESTFKSSASSPGDDDMSLDQVVGLMMGWWAVSHWSTDAENVRRARSQAGRVMGYLLAERFMIDQPGTRILVKRGGDARAAAGFLCVMARETTGEDYYHRAKVRLAHDNRCHTCGGTGEVNIPDPNVECPGCRGTGHAKIVLGGGRCEACHGSGEVKLVAEADCPACGGSGEIRVVVTNPFTGEDHTIGKTDCALCHGSGKVGGKTNLGKCLICQGKGRLPSYTRDLGKCKLCGGSGRLKGKLPRVKCPICGGSKELNVYVTLTHPLLLALEPLALLAVDVPRVGLHHGKVTVDGGNRNLVQSFVRHMNLVCMAFEPAVPDEALLLAARDSNHGWSVALRAAMGGTVCPACHGHGKLFFMAPEFVAGGEALHPHLTFKRHDLGTCKLCGGKGHAPAANPHRAILRAALDDLTRLHQACPEEGPGDRCPSAQWVKDNRWVRCTDLKRAPGTDSYNGLDFLSLEVLLRLAGAADRLKD
jgi:hypothetical protein